MSSSVLPAVGSSGVALPRPGAIRPGNARGSLPGSRTDLQGSPGGRYLRPSDIKRQQSRAPGKAGKDHRGVIHLDPASYRHSRSHNLCVQLLEDGYHESFVELFQLLQLQRGRREAAEPGSVTASEPLVEEDSLKLDQLRSYLTSAEASQRIGDLDAVYMCQRSLAQYFDQSGDIWLSDHFHQRCLQTSLAIRGDNRRKEGEAHCNVGLSLENRGELTNALSHLETFYQLARRHKWHTDSGDGLHEIACEHLRRVYTTLAERDREGGRVEYLCKALDMAKESGDSYQEGLAHYRIGQAYEDGGEVQLALKNYRSYFERCKVHADHEGMGKACQALAHTYEKSGDVEKAVEWLELYVDISENAGLKLPLMEACRAIGTLHNTLGNFDRACVYFKKCYALCREVGAPEDLHSAAVQYGIASAHVAMEGFAERLTLTDLSSVESIITWKDSRSQFDTEEEEEEEGEEKEEEEEGEEGEEEGEEGGLGSSMEGANLPQDGADVVQHDSRNEEDAPADDGVTEGDSRSEPGSQ